MGLAPLLTNVEITDDQRSLREEFLEATGYGSDDLLSLSYNTRTFLTRNGGKYKVLDDGSIDHLSGPPPEVEDRFE